MGGTWSIVTVLVASAVAGVATTRNAGATPSFVVAAAHPGAANGDRVVVADVTGDGVADVVVTGRRPHRVVVLPRNAEGALLAPVSVVADAEPQDLAAVDLDGDGALEVLVAVAGRLDRLVRRGRGGFGLEPVVELGHPVRGIAAGDVDGDGDLDAVVGRSGGADVDAVALLRNDGAGALGAPEARAVPAFPWRLAAGDLDGDGDVDLAVGSFDDTAPVAVLPNDGTGGFGPVLAIPAGVAPGPVAIVDLDDDGRTELAVMHRWANAVGVIRTRRPADGPCPGDLDRDGRVGIGDLVRVLVAWGPCPPGQSCPADLDGSGNVGDGDLAVVLAAWGPCPG